MLLVFLCLSVRHQRSVLVRGRCHHTDPALLHDLRAAEDSRPGRQDLPTGHQGALRQEDAHHVLCICTDDECHRDCHVDVR